LTGSDLKKINEEKISHIEHMLSGEQIKIFFTRSRTRYVSINYHGACEYSVEYIEKQRGGFARVIASARTKWRPTAHKEEVSAAAQLVADWVRSRA